MANRDLETRYQRMLDQDHDAEYGAVDDETMLRESQRNNRTLAFAAIGLVSVGAFVGGAVLYTANQQPATPRAVASAEPFTSASSPLASETSASPSPSISSASPSPRESKTVSALPTPSEIPSPTTIPSPSQSTRKVVLPSAMPETSTPETQSSSPQDCAWEQAGGAVTIGDCGDHTAYNDTQRSTPHPLSTGMQFDTPCLIDGMVEIHYGGSRDYLEDNGYFAVSDNC